MYDKTYVIIYRLGQRLFGIFLKYILKYTLHPMHKNISIYYKPNIIYKGTI